MLFAWIDEIQKSHGIEGDIFEIGVHHGKSAVLLGSLLDPGREELAVCDLFEDQGQNVSGSGFGQRHLFERNMASCLPGGIKVRIFSRSSSKLTPEETGTNYRLFHVDGGHTPEEALGDLRFAARVTIAEGVIAVDDPLTPVWPGVAEAIFRFLSEDRRFCALVAAFNKLLLVQRDSAQLYAQALDSEESQATYGLGYPWHSKVTPFMEHPMRVFFVPTSVRPHSIRTKLIRSYHRHRWLAPLASLARNLGRR